MKIGVLLSSNDSESAWNAFRFANTARDGGHDVRVFLMGKGVEVVALRDAAFDVGKLLRRFAKRGGEVLACGTCLDLRKRDAGPSCSPSTMSSFLDIVVSVDRLVSFG